MGEAIKDYQPFTVTMRRAAVLATGAGEDNDAIRHLRYVAQF